MIAKGPNAISLADALETLAGYSATDAIWWMEPRMELPKRHLKTELVVYQNGQQLVRRTLLSAAYPSLIRLLNRQAEHPLPLPHAADMEYENEAVLLPLRKQARHLCKKLVPLLNKMLRRQYLLEDAGLTTAAAQSWHSYATQLDQEAAWEMLRTVSKNAGVPHYICHSSQLAPLVPVAAAAYDKIQQFLAGPYPGPAQADKLDGTPTQLRRWYPHYVDHGVYIGRDPDNTPSMDQDEESGVKPPLVEESSPAVFSASRDDIREELVELRDQIDRLLARL